MRGVKFGHVFRLKIFFKSLTRPGLAIFLVACLSPGADGSLDFAFSGRPAFIEGWGSVVL